MKKHKRFILLPVIAVFLLTASILLHRQAQQPLPPASSSVDYGLTEANDVLPTRLIWGEKLPYTQFYQADGTLADLEDERGLPLVLLFWSPFCPHCEEQLALWKDATDILDTYGARLVLLARAGGERETISAASSYAQQHSLPWTVLYDQDRVAYEAWGVRRIPTTVILDSDGIVRAVRSEKLQHSELNALLQDALQGRSIATKAFLMHTMRQDGAIPSVYLSRPSPDAPILSETQGLAMECAISMGDRTIFHQVFSFTRNRMLLDSGLYTWRYREEEGSSPSNALLDDLRIYRALLHANDAWGGYEEDALQLRQALEKRHVQHGMLVDSYDTERRMAATKLSLHYANFEVLRILNPTLSQDTLSLVEEGYISDRFPLYYRAYDYRKKKYEDEDLHTAEALYTVWNLAKEGRVNPKTMEWLLKEVTHGGPMARYRTNGSVPAGYLYPSSAVFALVGLIALETEDHALLSQAILKLDAIRIVDSNSSANGAFGETSGAFYAFDQYMPLLLYLSLENY